MSEIEPGSIVLVDFEAWTDDGELFDTTRPDVAKEAGLDPSAIKGPIPILVGGGRVIPGFEEAIRTAEIGAETEVEVPPMKAFGEREEGLIRTFPIKEFQKQDMDPVPGMRVEMQRRRGTVTQVTASRVRVDFNHPYAGRALSYKFTVEKEITDAAEKAGALIDLAFKLGSSDDFDVSFDDGTLTVVTPEQTVMDPAWFMARHQLAHDLFDHLDVDTVEFVERLTTKGMEQHAHDHHGHGHAHGHEEE